MRGSVSARPVHTGRVAWLAAGILVIALGAAAVWRWRHPADPFASLAELESEHESSAGLSADRLRGLQEQLRTDPYNLTSLVALIHHELDLNPARAAEECQRVLLVSPRNHFALHHAAMAYVAMTNLDRALYYAAAALQVRDTPETHFVAGHIFFAKGDFPNALKHYRAALAANPRDETAQRYVADTERALVAKNPTTNSSRKYSISIRP